MKKFLSCILIFVILVGCLSGCGASDNKLSSADSVFVKPEKYAAIVNVSINPSFDIYLDEKAIVLGIEPKNEDAKAIDFSSYIGVELKTAIKDLVGVICENTPINRESVALVKFVEGKENILEVDVVEIINNTCADAFAKETVNESMESVLQIILEDEYGCNCVDCDNWYERHWYIYGEWERQWGYEEYEQYMEGWKKGLDTLDKNDPSYDIELKSYENMTYEKFDFKEIQRQNFYLSHENIYGKIEHEEKEITYKILESFISGDKVHKEQKEYTAEEFFEVYLEDEGIDFIDGLQKGFYAPIEVYINSEKQKGFYNFISYQVDGKWYVINGAMATPGA